MTLFRHVESSQEVKLLQIDYVIYPLISERNYKYILVKLNRKESNV